MELSGTCRDSMVRCGRERPEPDLNRRVTVLQTVAVPAEPLENQADSHVDTGGRSAGRSELVEPLSELATLVTRWATLPDHIRAAVRVLIGIAPPPVANPLDDSLPPGFEGAKGECG